MMKTKTILVSLMSLSSLSIANAALVADDFSSGLPSGGTAGWENDWQPGSNGAAGTGSATAASATPLAGNGDYVSVTGTGGTSTITYGMHRDYTGAIAIADEQTISFIFRIDTLDGTATGDASRALVTQGGTAYGLSSATSWALYVQDGTFRYFNGDGTGDFSGAATDSGTSVLTDKVYSATITNRIGADTVGPTTGGEWDLMLTNVTDGGTVLNLTDLEYRRTTVPTDADIGLGVAGPNATSFDQVSISTVPEPSSAALLGLGGLALMLRRRIG